MSDGTRRADDGEAAVQAGLRDHTRGINMKFDGLNQTEIDEFEQRRVKLRRAQQAAIGAVTAYDEALADIRDFVETSRSKSDSYYSDRSDEWDRKRGHPPKEAQQEFTRGWHHAELNLIAIADVMRDYAKILDELPLKPKA
jgi:hypothetical protein